MVIVVFMFGVVVGVVIGDKVKAKFHEMKAKFKSK